MDPNDQYEREEEALCDAYNAGELTLAQYNEQVRELQREYRAMAREAADEAYDREMDRW